MRDYISLKAIQGHIAMWAFRQSPYATLDGVMDVILILQYKVKEDVRLSTSEPNDSGVWSSGIWHGSELEGYWCWFETYTDIIRFLESTLKGDAMLKRWNTPRAEQPWDDRFVVVGPTTPKQDADFIDIDAMFRNVAQSVWNEAKTLGVLDGPKASKSKNLNLTADNFKAYTEYMEADDGSNPYFKIWLNEDQRECLTFKPNSDFEAYVEDIYLQPGYDGGVLPFMKLYEYDSDTNILTLEYPEPDFSLPDLKLPPEQSTADDYTFIAQQIANEAEASDRGC